MVDGEIVIAGPSGLDFEALLLRIHPAASRVKLLAEQTPASFVAWDLLALGDEDLRNSAAGAARARLEQALTDATKPVHLSPATLDRALAEDWFRRFEGAGLDGVMAKRLDAPYRAGERTMIKVKHKRTADCVVAGFRWHKNGQGTMVGSLLLGLYDDAGMLHHVGVTASFTNAVRKQLVDELAPLRENALEGHPWRDWADAQAEATARGSACLARRAAGTRQGPELGAAAARACGRGRVRAHAGHALPPRRAVRALAAGQAARGLPLRSTRGDASLRAGAGVRRAGRITRRRVAHPRNERRRRALPMTDTELRLIAAAAIIGLSRRPNTG